MTRIKNPIVPVLMFHSVADATENVPCRHLCVPVKLFDQTTSYLKTRKFNTITLQELYNHLSVGEPLPPKPIVITFDDGFLDNWVNAFPILKKHGLKATIFVTPEFVDPTPELRPTLSDVWEGQIKEVDLTYWGFLSWNEMREMVNSGLIDIQSHTLTHTWLFQGSEIVDFHHPGDSYPWLAWNKHPEKKYRWLAESQESLVPFGTPVYSYGRALAAPQYFPDKGLTNSVVEYVNRHGGASFFETLGWRKSLFDLARDYKKQSHVNGRYETEPEYKERIRRELVLSKELIERNLGKKVDFLCWPGGAFTETAVMMAEEAGYLATTKGTAKNAWGADPKRIHRVGASVASLSKRYPFLARHFGLFCFAAKVNSYRGNLFYSLLLSASFTAGRTFRQMTARFLGRP
jgi:peptidoglycan/xylan/chitin deacetylase (PgdA/CDA1 family)